MEFLVYNENISKEELLDMHIVVENYKIGKNVKLGLNVCLLGTGEIGNDCVISSNSILENAVLGEGVEVKVSNIEDSFVGDNTTVGPFAHIRGGSKIKENCRIGNFVELKNAEVGAHSKMAHLTYVGDAKIGENCNVGCGVIFCNYNGKIKQKTFVGDNVFIGSNTNLVAPLNIGDNVYIACGSTITQDIKSNEFAIARNRQTNKKGFKNPYLDRD